jgi:hypothetical protein
MPHNSNKGITDALQKKKLEHENVNTYYGEKVQKERYTNKMTIVLMKR